MKRALIIAGIAVLALALVGGGIWLRMRSVSVPGPEAEAPSGGLPVPTGPASGTTPAPEANQGGGIGLQSGLLRAETKKPILGYGFESGGGIVAVEEGGPIIRSAKQESSVVGTSPITPPLAASFSFDGKKVLLAGENDSSGVLDIASSTWRVLGSLSRAAWSPSDYRIAYVAPRTSLWALSTIDAKIKTSKPQVLLSFANEELSPLWVFPEKIFLREQPSALVVTSLFKFDVKKKTFTRIIQGRGATAAWDKESGRGVVLLANERGGSSLALVDGDGNIERQLSFVTIPTKCTFETKTLEPQAGTPAKKKSWLICAIPRDRRTFESSLLPDAYYQKELRTEDSFYRVDLETGMISAIFGDASESIDASDVRAKDGRVYFINRYDNLLYSIPSDIAVR